MDINTIKEYARLNRRRMMPSVSECSDSNLAYEFKQNLARIRELRKNNIEFANKLAKDGKEMFHVKDTSVTMFLISCLPLLLCLPAISSRIFGDEEFLGRIVGYALTAVILFVRPYLQAFITHLEVDDVAHYMRLGLLAICFVMSDIFDIAILGTRYAWVLVFVLGGVGITCIFRAMDKKRFTENNEYFDNGTKEVEELNTLCAQTEKIYAKLFEKEEAELQAFIKENGLRVAPIPRKAWFNTPINRSGKAYSEASMLWVDTDFKHEFENVVDDYDKDEHHHITYSQEVNSQTFGWKDSNSSEVEGLIKSGKIYPYFGLGLPELSTELNYKLFRHQWDVSVNIRDEVFYEAHIERNDIDLKAFNDKVKEVQDEVFGGVFGKALYELGWMGSEGKELSDYFDEKVEEVGSKIPEFVEVPAYHNVFNYTKHKVGDEIGTVLAYTPDGELVGVYSGNSTEAIRFTQSNLKDHPELKFTPYSQPVGEAQEKYYQVYCDRV